MKRFIGLLLAALLYVGFTAPIVIAATEIEEMTVEVIDCRNDPVNGEDPPSGLTISIVQKRGSSTVATWSGSLDANHEFVFSIDVENGDVLEVSTTDGGTSTNSFTYQDDNGGQTSAGWIPARGGSTPCTVTGLGNDRVRQVHTANGFGA